MTTAASSCRQESPQRCGTNALRLDGFQARDVVHRSREAVRNLASGLPYGGDGDVLVVNPGRDASVHGAEDNEIRTARGTCQDCQQGRPMQIYYGALTARVGPKWRHLTSSTGCAGGSAQRRARALHLLEKTHLDGSVCRATGVTPFSGKATTFGTLPWENSLICSIASQVRDAHRSPPSC